MTNLTLRKARPSYSLFDEIASDFFGASPFFGLATRHGKEARFSPSFDLSEREDAYVIEADLPGVSEDDLDVHITANQLTVSGARKAEERKEGDNYYLYERRHGSFSRTFTLPQNSVGQDIEASLENGVLKVVVPKVPEAKPRKIRLSAKA